MSPSSQSITRVQRARPFPGATAAAEAVGESAGSVIVGIDGSQCAELALQWALHHAGTFGRVTPVMTYQLPVTWDPLTRKRPGSDPSLQRSAAEACLATAIGEVDPTLAVKARILEAHPGVGLVQAAAEADLLVVGTRGRGGVKATLLGSVSSYCVTHATVPVIVIPPNTPPDKPLKTIAVGIDGSSNADAALKWAIEHISADGTVLAVGAGSAFGYMSGEFDPTPEMLERYLSGVVEESVARAAVGSGTGPQIVIVADPSDVRVVLPKIAADFDADVLVLGARGTTGVPYLLLGSVSTALVHHPVMPTVIVPGDENRGSDQ